MKRTLIGLVLTLVCSGCAYNGTLRNGFYSPPPVAPVADKMPLTVNLVCGNFFKSIIVDSGHIYGDYSVHLKTDPALQNAIKETCESVFQTVYVSSVADPKNPMGVDIVILPSLEVTENHITLTFTVKRADLSETLQTYSSADNYQFGAPAGVHVLDTLDIFACGGLAPIIIPANTSMIGHRGEDILEERLSYCLNQIADSMKSDMSLVAKTKRTQ